MSITYELTEDELNAVHDAKEIVSLVEALAAGNSNRIDISRAELCAFTTVVIGKLSAVLDAAEERYAAARELCAGFDQSASVIGDTQSIRPARSRAHLEATDATLRSAKRLRREAAAV